MRRRATLRVLALPLCVAALHACEQAFAPEPPLPTIAELGDPVLGRLAFETECAGCHATRDGFDLAFFAFTDTTIVRRAVAHVDTASAFDIVAYVRTLPVVPASQDVRLFQPGGVLLSSDLQFAERLFGADTWPAGLSANELRAIDPLQTPVAVAFPIWSVEEDNLDWMPDDPLEDGVLDYRSGLPEVALDMYYSAGSLHRLEGAVSALRAAERDPHSAGAPCVVDPLARLQPEVCFETRRWIASLGAQHMLREGMSSPMSDVVHDVWWDVGNAARKSIQRGTPIDHALENWVSWMWAGWAFNPDGHSFRPDTLGSRVRRLRLSAPLRTPGRGAHALGRGA